LDGYSAAGSAYYVAISDVLSAVDGYSVIGVYLAYISESAAASDSWAQRFLWIPITDTSSPNWTPITDTSSPNWTPVITYKP